MLTGAVALYGWGSQSVIKRNLNIAPKTYDDVQTHTNACNAASRLKQNAVLGISW